MSSGLNQLERQAYLYNNDSVTVLQKFTSTYTYKYNFSHIVVMESISTI